jgi:hypothetical protein
MTFSSLLVISFKQDPLRNFLALILAASMTLITVSLQFLNFLSVAFVTNGFHGVCLAPPPFSNASIQEQGRWWYSIIPLLFQSYNPPLFTIADLLHFRTANDNFLSEFWTRIGADDSDS